jgi:flagellar protein FliS
MALGVPGVVQPAYHEQHEQHGHLELVDELVATPAFGQMKGGWAARGQRGSRSKGPTGHRPRRGRGLGAPGSVMRAATMDGISAYNENAVTMQSRGRLIVMLYEGAIRFLNQALQELQAGRFHEKGQLINKAVDIIDELSFSLDAEAGGEVAANLRRLYVFMVRHLNEANTRKDPQRIREVITLLEDLNQGWKAITS